MEKPSQFPKRSIAAAIAMVIMGLLVFVPSGLCTGGMMIAITSEAAGGRDLSAILIPLVVGGPFVAGGAALLWFGIKEIRAYLRKG